MKLTTRVRKNQNVTITVYSHAAMKNPAHRPPYVLSHDDLVVRVIQKMRKLGDRLAGVDFDTKTKNTILMFERR